MWIEIFKGGSQTDSTGARHDGDALIDSAVATFDAGIHHPPLVLGHPKDDSPAYGWVEGVKADIVDGVKRLFADIAPVDALREWVNAKLYQHRSASFYPDGRLRHVGFLGGRPPAVKGLAPLPAFADADECIAFEFSETRPWTWSTIADVFRKLREWIIEKDGKETADAIIPNWDIDEVKAEADKARQATAETGDIQLYSQGGNMKFSEFMNAINLFKKAGGKDEEIDLIAPVAATDPHAGGTFTEADLEAAKQQAAKEAKAAALAEFAESEATRHKAERAGRIKQFCDEGIKAGKLAPAWIAAGMAQFMEQLADEAAAAIAFSEGGEKKTPDAWFREFLEGLPKLVDFSEIATRGTDVGGGDAGGKLEALVKKKRAEKPDLGYGAAFAEVQKENPELAAEYAASITG